MNDLFKLKKQELFQKCEELNIISYKSKSKPQLIQLIQDTLKSETTEKLQETIDAKITDKSTTIKFIDLFCGIGGFHQALSRFSNTECVFACDIDEKCRKIYEKNYKIKPEKDITKIDISKIPNFDVLCGGFPCQSFSNSGKKKGFDDSRGNLFEYILKIAVSKNPTFLFLENVKHIKKIDNGKVFTHILSRINESGYYVGENTIFELSPHQLGIPQQRERVIFVCIRKDIYDEKKQIPLSSPSIPIDLHKILETDPIQIEKYRISSETEDILKIWNEIIQQMNANENLSPTILCHEFYRNYSPTEFQLLPDWKKDYIQKNRPLYEKYREKWDQWYNKNQTFLQKKEIYGKLEWQVGKTKTNESIFDHFIQLRQSGIRVKKSIYFPTLVAIVQTPIYAKEKRYITPRECARLQSFPDSFIMSENDHDAYKQFGNAVNVDVIHFVMERTFQTYSDLPLLSFKI
jgi:DNA (cytosine-5)-methyltransferase 1